MDVGKFEGIVGIAFGIGIEFGIGGEVEFEIEFGIEVGIEVGIDVGIGVVVGTDELARSGTVAIVGVGIITVAGDTCTVGWVG